MIQISTFPAAPSTERVPSLAERVASLRYSINLQLLNNRVPGLVATQMTALVGCICDGCDVMGQPLEEIDPVWMFLPNIQYIQYVL